jgi:hypothetical protein
MSPKVIAAIAGPKKAAAASAAACDPATRTKEGKQDRGAGHDKGGADNDRSFGAARIGQRASWSLHDEAADGGNRHHEADLILRPMTLRQEINREIGS